MEYVFIALVFLVILTVKMQVNQLESRIKRMQASLDQIIEQSGLPEHPVNDELRQLIREGADIKAIKKAREALGLSLIEGKEYIEQLKSEEK